eukprot:481560-Prymnesium_polylepis.2
MRCGYALGDEGIDARIRGRGQPARPVVAGGCAHDVARELGVCGERAHHVALGRAPGAAGVRVDIAERVAEPRAQQRGRLGAPARPPTCCRRPRGPSGRRQVRRTGAVGAAGRAHREVAFLILLLDVVDRVEAVLLVVDDHAPQRVANVDALAAAGRRGACSLPSARC